MERIRSSFNVEFVDDDDEQSQQDRKVVCITGITGYIGSWILYKFLESGKYKIKGTVRQTGAGSKFSNLEKFMDDLGDENEISERFKDPEFFEAVEMDLDDRVEVENAIRGCDYVVHVASRHPLRNPKDSSKMIDTAVEGTK